MMILGYFMGIVTGIALIAALLAFDSSVHARTGRTATRIALDMLPTRRPIILDPEADKGNWDQILESAGARRED